MKRAQATDEGATPGTETIDLDAHADGRDGGDDEGSDDDPEVLAAMMAGHASVSENKPLPKELQDTDEGRKQFGRGSDSNEEDEGGDDKPTTIVQDGEQSPDTPTEDDENRVVFGGMSVKQLREKLDKTDALEKAVSGLAGRIGHMTQQIQAGATPKPLTKEDFPALREEFGDEYADAVARDMSKIVTAKGGAGIDQEAVTGLLATETMKIEQNMERKAVKRAHPDVADYWPGGKENAKFIAWANQLPEERKNLVLNTWDSDVLIPALNDFKSTVNKAAKDAAAAGSRLQRSTPATTGASASAPAQPDFDPVMAGWKSVKGTPRKGQMGARR